MPISQFITANQLRPADAVILRKGIMGLLNHYAIFLGYGGSGQPVFIANFTKGIQILSQQEIHEFLIAYKPVGISRFQGTEAQREMAVERALSRRGEDDYHLILNNCEHFANYVQKGEASSSQSKAGIALGVLGLIGLGIALLSGGGEKDEEEYRS